MSENPSRSEARRFARSNLLLNVVADQLPRGLSSWVLGKLIARTLRILNMTEKLIPLAGLSSTSSHPSSHDLDTASTSLPQRGSLLSRWRPSLVSRISDSWSRSSRSYQLAPAASEFALGPTLDIAASRRSTPRRSTVVKTSCALLIALAIYIWTPWSASTTHRIDEIPELRDSQCPSVLKFGVDAIPCHHELAQRKLDRLLAQQSKTYEQAVERYAQQYHRQPPPGFDDWFRFAQENGALIVDEFAQMERNLAPLRQVPGHVLRQRVKAARKMHQNDWLHEWVFANGTLTTDAPDDAENARFAKEICAPFVHKLPDFTVLRSFKGPRNSGPKFGRKDDYDPAAPLIYSKGDPDAKDLLKYGCPRNTISTSFVSSDRPSVDLCAEADNWLGKHGRLNLPQQSFTTTLPLLSMATLSSFQDVTPVPWCYASVNYRLNDRTRDKVAYADKKPRLFWRGSNTGWLYQGPTLGYSNHRHRLLMFVEQMKHKAVQLASRIRTADEPGLTDQDAERVEMPYMPKTFTSTQLSALSRLSNDSFDLGFTNLHHECEGAPGFCNEWNDRFPLAPKVSAWDFSNKFALDIDGDHMSCRFYRLLESNSLVFKQTIYIEYHDDRLLPWLHYIPVTTGYEELPMLIDYFANHPVGQQLGEKIANASRDWANVALRQIDLSIYTYRQMLELAHIVGHD